MRVAPLPARPMVTIMEPDTNLDDDPEAADSVWSAPESGQPPGGREGPPAVDEGLEAPAPKDEL